MKIAIIGCGNMGMAFARAFLKFDLVKNEDFLLVEKSEERMENLKTSFKPGVITGLIGPQIGTYDLIILSVKPQDFPSIAAEIAKVIRPDQIVLSIMAGITIQKIQEGLNHTKVIRAMPNTPAMLGMGITAYTASATIEQTLLHKIENLINATGRSVYLEDESLIDGVTAVSGSGPAYFFYLVKGMIESGVKLGFDEAVAALLVKQTMLGAYHLMNADDKTLDDLIQAVTSKGGTTEAALNTFASKGLNDVIDAGIVAARDRSVELSKG